jgi:dTDP-4-dehydrorhamnose 3,5-epimerase
MEIVPLEIPDVLLITPRRFGDERGWFEETWNARRFAEAGLEAAFVQDNQSLSKAPGTIRGLHFQAPPHAQAKLVRVAFGAVLDVAVDIREGSETYGRWVSAELSDENGAQLFVPRGFAHAFCTRVANTAVCYKVDGFYDKESEGGIRFDDPDLAIDWGIDPADAVLSDKDRALPRLRDLGAVFT